MVQINRPAASHPCPGRRSTADCLNVTSHWIALNILITWVIVTLRRFANILCVMMLCPGTSFGSSMARVTFFFRNENKNPLVLACILLISICSNTEENIFSRCFLDAAPFQHHFFPSCYLLIFELNRSLAYQLMVTCVRSSRTVGELRYQSSKRLFTWSSCRSIMGTLFCWSVGRIFSRLLVTNWRAYLDLADNRNANMDRWC